MNNPPSRDGADDTALTSLYTPDEVATSIRMSRWWVIAKARSGEFPHLRLGRLYRFSEDDLAEIRRIVARPATKGAA